MGEQAPKKYILCRRDADHYNEVIEAGPKAPTAMGIVDFHGFMKKHGLYPEELAQLLKVPINDIRKLVEHGGWIDSTAQENLSLALKLPPDCRKYVSQFLSVQDGAAGSLNVYKPPMDVV